jgi:hypothetical protein
MDQSVMQILQAMLAITPPSVDQGGGMLSGGGGGVSHGGGANLRGGIDYYTPPQQQPMPNPLANIPQMGPGGPGMPQGDPNMAGGMQGGVGAAPAGGAPGMMPPSLARQISDAQRDMYMNQNPQGIRETLRARKERGDVFDRAGQAAYNYQSWQQQQQGNQKLSALDQIEQNVFSTVLGMTGSRDRAAEVAKLARSNPEEAKSVMTQIAEKTYQNATDAQQNAEAMGLQPGSPEYNEYVRAATIRKGQEINLNTTSPPAKDYRRIYDENGNVVRDEVIEGSDTWKEEQTAGQRAEMKARDELYKMENAIGVADTAIGQVGNFTAGLLGTPLSKIPGSEAADLKANVDTLKAITAFKELFDMRQASPTGGALGNVSNVEIGLLYNSWRNLETSQSPEQLRKNLTELRDHYRRVSFLIENKDQIEDMSAKEQRKFADESLGLGAYAKKEEPKAKSNEGWGIVE